MKFGEVDVLVDVSTYGQLVRLGGWKEVVGGGFVGSGVR